MGFTRAVVSAAAVWLAVVGVACLFAPDLVLARLGSAVVPGASLLVQVLGTLALGLGALDWMWKGNRLGGVYGRPIALANLFHFMSTTLVAVSALSREPALVWLWPLAGLYAAMALAWFRIMLTDPQRTGDVSRPHG